MPGHLARGSGTIRRIGKVSAGTPNGIAIGSVGCSALCPSHPRITWAIEVSPLSEAHPSASIRAD